MFYNVCPEITIQVKKEKTTEKRRKYDKKKADYLLV
jgi:hypothetical protein